MAVQILGNRITWKNVSRQRLRIGKGKIVLIDQVSTPLGLKYTFKLQKYTKHVLIDRTRIYYERARPLGISKIVPNAIRSASHLVYQLH